MEKKKIRTKELVMGGAAFLLLILLDQLTKVWAVDRLKDQQPIVWIQGVFELSYVENRGAAFGLFQNQRILFLICMLVVLVAAAYIYVKLPAEKRFIPMRTIAVFVGAGAVGNAIDRIFRGYVVDFFYFSLIDFPVFNVADIYVTVSMAFFLLLILFYYKEEDLQTLSLKKRM
jgi:signal peptidase II